jgi:hypothetical protein
VSELGGFRVEPSLISGYESAEAIRQLNDAAEDALKSVKRRNNLATLHEQRGRRDLHREIQRKQSRSASELRTPDLNSPHPDKHVPSLPSNYERTGDVIPV